MRRFNFRFAGRSVIAFLIASPIGLLSAGCSPKIYLVDRQTVLEEEAAGEWPDFEAKLLKTSTRSGPTPFPESVSSKKKDRLYQVLNGEFGTQVK